MPTPKITTILPPPLLFLTLLTLLLLIHPTHSYSSLASIDTASSATISNFKQDLGACSCNITTSCDTFCCCDQVCSTDDITKWTSSSWCIEQPVQIQKLCSNIGSKGYSTFQDMGCVIFSNRGAIGQFYSVPAANNIIDPNVQKFSTHNANAQSISPNTVISSSTYKQNSAIKISLTVPVSIYLPSIGSTCRLSSLAIQQGTYSHSCQYSITDSASCLAINHNIVQSHTAVSVCQYGNCSSVAGTSFTIPAATYTGTTCSNYIQSLSITATIDYLNSQYRIVSFTLIPTLSATPIDTSLTNKITISTTVSISKSSTSVSTSGNPGYIVGKPLSYTTGSIYQFMDTTTKTCITSATLNTNIATAKKLNIRFGINQTYYCLANDPCGSVLYIDQLSRAANYKISKYASQSNQSVSVTGMASTSCNIQAFTINVLYSYSGWILDPQYYVLGATVTGDKGIGSGTVMKQLSIKWILVQPSAISSPPSNYFYNYFQRLWLPLKGMYYGTTFQGWMRVREIVVVGGFVVLGMIVF